MTVQTRGLGSLALLMTLACSHAPAVVAPQTRTPRPLPVLAPVDTQPPSADEPVWAPPEVFERRLDSGIRMLVAERRDLPIVRLRFLIKRGAADAPAGVASFAAALLLPSETISGRRPFGVGSRYFAGQDALGFDAFAITRWQGSSNLPDETFAGFCNLLKNPVFPEASLMQERAWRLASSYDEDRDMFRAARSLERAALYPSDYPYYELAAGNQQAIEGINADALSQFFRDQVKPDQLVVVAVGDVAHESLFGSVAIAFQRWQGRATPRRPLPPLEPLSAVAPLVVIDRPELTQSRILVAARGVPWRSADFEALTVLDAVLGGRYTSQLNLILRESRSFSYGAWSSFRHSRGDGPFEAQSSVAKQDTSAALSQIAAVFAALRVEPLTPEALSVAKRAAVRRIAMMGESLESLLTAVSELGAYDQPANYYGSAAGRIAAVSAADVQRVARAYLAPEKLRWFVIGDAATITPLIAQAGFTAVRVEP